LPASTSDDSAVSEPRRVTIPADPLSPMPGSIPSPPKILLVGEYLWPWYQEACARALESLGCEIVRFGWLDDLYQPSSDSSQRVYRSFRHHLEDHFLLGPTLGKINHRLVETARAEKPDVVWFYNVKHIYPTTVRALRKALPRATFCQYANDDPFSPDASKMRWRHFIRSIPFFDLHYCYRQRNIPDFQRHGARQVFLLRSYYIPEEDHPVPEAEIDSRFRCDVVFAGHYEDDGRLESLDALARTGSSVNLFGGGWDGVETRLAADSPLQKCFPVRPVVGDDYRQAICGAKIALCFLSTLNRDTYTRRSFQIPAMGSLMLSQYSEELAKMFEPDRDAAFFHNPDELIQKARWYLEHEAERKEVARQGKQRVERDGHDVTSRMRQFLETLKEAEKQ